MQVDDQDDEQSSRQKQTKTSKAEGHVKVSGRRAKDKNFSSEEPASKQYPGYELLLDDDSDVEMEVELPKGTVVFFYKWMCIQLEFLTDKQVWCTCIWPSSLFQ